MNTGFDIETRRLRIRAWHDGDRPALERMVADADMMRYVSSGRSWRDDEVDEFMQRQSRHLANSGFCMGALVLKPGDEVIGVAGLQPLDKDGGIELGWWVWKAYWGRGYATEAGAALVRHGFERLGLARLVAVIEPGNAASICVAEKLGLRFEKRMSAKETMANRDDLEIAIYSIER